MGVGFIGVTMMYRGDIPCTSGSPKKLTRRARNYGPLSSAVLRVVVDHYNHINKAIYIYITSSSSLSFSSLSSSSPSLIYTCVPFCSIHHTVMIFCFECVPICSIHHTVMVFCFWCVLFVPSTTLYGLLF